MNELPGDAGRFPLRKSALPLAVILSLLLLGCPNPVKDPGDEEQEPDEPDIYLQQDGDTVGQGESVPFAATLVGESRGLTFTIENRGTADLLITGGTVSLSGSATFTLQQPPAATIEADAESTFTVQFAPISTDSQEATVSIASNDPDENLFSFQVTGSGSVVGGSILVNGGDLYTNSTSVTLTLSPDDPGSVAQMLLSNNADFSGADWVDLQTSYAWTLDSGDGTKTVYVKFRDDFGNESSAFSDDILLDATPPGAPGTPNLVTADDSGISTTDDLTNKTSSLNFAGSGAEAGSTIQLYANAVILAGATATAAADGSWTSADASLAEGTWSITARATDPAGNTSDPSTGLPVEVDTTAPAEAPAILTPMQGANTGTQKRPTFTWTAVAGAARYDFHIDDASSFVIPLILILSSYDGTSYTPASDLAVSTTKPVGKRYYLRVRAVDAAGNSGPYSHPGMKRYVNVGRFDQDLNGDGYSDVLVGVPNRETDAGTDVGAARVFLGGSPMNAIVDLIPEGAAAGDKFGSSVAFAGDVNADGYGDLLVGAPCNDAAGTDAGAAYLYLGGSTPNATADLTLNGASTYDLFGLSVAGVGDVNGDGYADLVVKSQSAACLYLGRSAPNATADLTVTCGTSFIHDRAVSGAGDVNGDGYADFLVAHGGTAVYLFLGGGTLSAAADLTLTGSSTNVNFGCSVAGAGDVNGDGYGDILVGTPNDSFTGLGRAYLYFGDPVPNDTIDLLLPGGLPNADFGFSVAGAGDVNADGYADLIGGAPYPGYMGTNPGTVYLFLGGAAPNIGADLTLTVAAGGGQFGYSVSGAGDVNGDGYADFIIGDRYNDGGATEGGAAFVYYGGATLDDAADVTPSGATWAANDNFGTSVD
jgi:hypothetical protein